MVVVVVVVVGGEVWRVLSGPGYMLVACETVCESVRECARRFLTGD